MDKILLFIPAYNCEDQITRVLDKVSQANELAINEIIIVNNISTDKTEEKVVNYIKNDHDLPLKLLRNNENYGLGGSHKVAFQYAHVNNFDYIIVLHGDDQGDIEDLKDVIMNKKYRDYDSVLGARFMKGSKLKGYSRFRTFGNRVYNLIFSILLGFKVYDLGSGLNMYSVKSLSSDYFIKFPDNLTFNYCMVMAIKYYRQKIMFVPISWSEDDQVSNVKMTSQAIKVLHMLFNYFFNNKKFMESDHREKAIIDYGSTEVKINEKTS